MERLIELARKRGIQAEVYHSRDRTTPVRFASNKLKQLTTTDSEGVALRVIVDGKLGFSTTTKCDDPDQVFADAVAVAAYGPSVEFGFAGPDRLLQLKTEDQGVRDLKLETLISLGQESIDTLKPLHPNLLADIYVSRAEQEVRILTTEGLDARYRGTMFYANIGAEIVEGQNMLQVWDGWGGADFQPDRVRAAVADVAEKVRQGLVNVPLAAGAYTVVLRPLAVRDLLGPYSACLNGRNVEKGISPWRDKLGETLASPLVSLIDDPTRDLVYGASPFDAEGTPTRRLPLVDKGVLTSFRLDRRAAQALGQAPTGSAGKSSLDTAPMPNGLATTLAPGETSVKTMLKGMGDGLVIDYLMGAWAGNLLAGQVTGNILLGYKVEGGVITGRVKDAMFSTNAFEALKDKLIAVSREVKETGGMTLPCVQLADVNISVKQ
ncbi:MAG: TldD/PmbA family protein [Bacillota bacterium]